MATDPKKKNLELRAEIERKRYELAQKYTDDAKLARKARGWSDPQKWVAAFGDKVDRKAIPQFPKTPREPGMTREEYNQLRRERYKHLRELGFTSKEATRQRSAPRYRKVLEDLGIKEPKIIIRRVTRKSREEQWKDWARDQIFPSWVEDYVGAINRSKDLDPDAGYGWGILWYWYTRGGSIEEWLKRLDVDKHDHDMYVFANAPLIAK